jgi:type IV secretion system protein VirB4
MDVVPLLTGVVAGGLGYRALEALREHRAEPVALADLLQWAWLVADGVVLNKDGALLAGWSYRGPDLQSATHEEVAHLARQVGEALLPFGDGWMFHTTAIRRPAPGYAPQGAFPQPVLRLLDEERREAYSAERCQFETATYMTVTYLPPAEVYTRLQGLFLEGEAGAARRLDWQKVVEAYGRQLQDLELRLQASLKLERLGSPALLTHLHECLTGLDHPVGVPANGSYLDTVLADQDLVGGWQPRVGDLHLRVVSVHGFPESSTPGLLDALGHVGFPCRWTTRTIPLEAEAAERLIRRLQQGWLRKRGGLSHFIHLVFAKRRSARDAEVADLFANADARAMVEDAARAAADNAGGRIGFCHYTATVLLLDADAPAVDRHAAEVVKTLRNLGFTVTLETVNAVEAWLGSLPGHGHQNLRRFLVSSEVAVDLLPLTQVWAGLPANPCKFFPPGSPALLYARTSGSTPFRFGLWHEDVGHALVIGRTGGGKSTLINTLIASFFRYAGAQAFLFDIGYSGALLALAAGAEHYDLAAPDAPPVRLQPLAHLDAPADFAKALDWLEGLLVLQGAQVTPSARGALETALHVVAQQERPNRTLTELVVQLQHVELKRALEPYSLRGAWGFLLNHRQDDVRDHPYQVFELVHLMELDDRVRIPTLLHLFQSIERRLTGRPTLIVIEEAWLPLLHPAFSARINAWLLGLRKLNAAVVLVTQSLAQLNAAPGRHVIFQSCPTRVLLPDHEALSPSVAPLYRDLGLNERELEILAAARPRRDYYATAPAGRRLFDLGLGPVALSFLAPAEGLTTRQTLAAARALQDAAGEGWTATWLRARGCDAWASRLEALTSMQSIPRGHEHAA